MTRQMIDQRRLSRARCARNPHEMSIARMGKKIAQQPAAGERVVFDL